MIPIPNIFEAIFWSVFIINLSKNTEKESLRLRVKLRLRLSVRRAKPNFWQ
jgi:hypothetical protein